MDFPALFFFTALGGALNYTCLTCHQTSPGFYWSPFSSLKFDLEMAFSFYIFTQNTEKQETEPLAMTHRKAGLTAFAGVFLSDRASSMTKHASVSRSVKWIPFVIGGGSSMVYWHASLHLPPTGISSFWGDPNVLTKVCLKAPRKELDQTLDLHWVIYACLVTTRNSLRWEESWVRHRKTQLQNKKRKR